MVGQMVHRGPDDDGFYDTATVHLGMRRLSIVDLENGQQPKTSADGQIVVLFNGEIYNHVELRTELEAAGCRFESHSDTEVLVHGYLTWGLAMLDRLVGMFAISLYDRRSGELILIRDRLGKKPIYYLDEPGLFAYASEYPVLASLLPDGEQYLDRSSLAWYFSQKTTPADRAIDTRIKKVPPGHLLRVSSTGAVVAERWWSIAAGRVAVGASEAAIVDDIEQLLTSAVKLRMRADTEVGAFLSGGIDSSLCVALASRCTDKPLKTYCLIYDQEINHKGADRRWANSIAERYGTRHREILLTPAILVEDLPRIIRHYGQPNSAVLSNWFISKEMGKELKVALSGDGADELFGSYYLHRAAAAVAALEAGDDALLARIPAGEAEFARTHRGQPHALLADAFAIFSDEEMQRLAPTLGASSREMLQARERDLATQHVVDRALEFDCRNLLVDQILNYSDTLSMAHSLEVRTPFLDHRLVDYMFSVPADLKMRPGETKRLLKQVAARYLPEELITRPKEGFVEPAVYWIGDALRDFCRAHLLASGFNRLGLLDASYVRALVERFDRDKDFTTGKKVWNLLVFAIWEAQLPASSVS
ncbi:MAG: Asparagine synthase, glutamine-hydrolyzing [Myxococcales bacterium]|nr:Asparagine synthase, glutamine-hydrolyzing [Myxococcales bacterium]